MTEVATRKSAAAALARYYDLDLIDDPGDLALYEALATRTGGPILEFAAGTGRLAVPLAAAGHAVTALDIDEAMLARAGGAWSATQRSKRAVRRGNLTLVEADLLTASLPDRFALAILALNSLLLLGDCGRQSGALAALARHLLPDGVAVIDIWLPGADDLALYDGRLILEWLRDDGETGRRVSKVAGASHDGATATVTLTQIFDSWPVGGGPVERVERVDRMRLVGADELVAMAEAAGLEVERLAGDYAMNPFGYGSERAILLAHPKPGRTLV